MLSGVKTLSRRPRLLAATVVTGALLVPAAVLGGAQAAVAVAQYAYGSSGSQYGHGSASQYQYRVVVCHRTGSRRHPFHTVVVSAHALRALLHHGDHLGRCTGAEALRWKLHEHGRGHGKSHDEGFQASRPQHGSKHR